ncbi:hypothetical protein [Brevundimonas lenta]|uniref:PH domain-containing protein n=1 Tax=Brevundimonas lenta TaxID=424796 RepID=A0A7W6JFV1_9CAUL|nr:hypothetical protein [Brevundimonas lenta]MBB4084404.1 hypothetical protein [Brevundimonas lenta]
MAGREEAGFGGPGPLHLRSFNRQGWLMGLCLLGVGIVKLGLVLWSGEPVSWMAGLGIGVFLASGTLFAALGLHPVELWADDVGIHWRQIFWRRTFPWARVEEIGIRTDKNFEGYDKPVVRVLTGFRTPPNIPPALGLRLTPLPGEQSGMVAARRGLSGFDIGLNNVFDVGLGDLVEELQRRQALARAAE